MPERAPRIIMAFDFGRRRVGIACGDTVSLTAAPLTGVTAREGEPEWPALDALLRGWQPHVLVVGVPYHADDTESAMSAAARRFAAALERRYALPVCLIDERYSSLEAAARLRGERAAGLRRGRVRKADVDAAAACVILERWFSESSRGAHAVTTR